MDLRKALGRHRAGGLLALFLCIELLDEVIDGLSSAAWPLIRADLSLSYIEIGLLFSVPSIVAQLVEPPIGLLGDVWRRFALITLGGFAYAAALMAFAGADGFVPLLLGMCLLYPASGTFVSLAQASLMDAADGDEEQRMVVWTVAGSVGVAVGPLLLAGALALGWSWRTPHALMATVALVLALGVFALRPNGARDDDEQPTLGEVLREAWRAIRSGGVLRWLFLLEAVDLLLEVFVGFLALYLVDDVGASPAMAAAAMTVWTVAALVGESALVLLLRRFDGLTIVRASVPVVALLFPAFMLTPRIGPKLALLGALALASAGWYSIVKAQFYRAMEGRTGTAMALGTLLGPLHALVPFVVGLLAESYGLGSALWIVMVAPLAMSVALRRVG